MKNPVHSLRSWYADNCKYDGFFQSVVFCCLTLVVLAHNICVLSTDLFDWYFFSVELVFTCWMMERWKYSKQCDGLHDFYNELLRHAQESKYAVIENSTLYRQRLLFANRRRKRAELALKKCRKKLRCVRTVKLEYEMKCSEYEDALLTAYTATYDYSVKASVSEGDIVRAKKARIRFNEYMGKHYVEMARNKFWREYRQDIYDCLFFPHSEFTPEHTDGFYHLLQNGGNDGAVVEIKENQES